MVVGNWVDKEGEYGAALWIVELPASPCFCQKCRADNPSIILESGGA